MEVKNKSYLLEQRNGFTLIEILLVIAMMGILLGIMAPISWSFMMQNELDVATGVFAQSLRRAQNLAIASSADSPWGVKLDTQQIIIFKGSSFAGRDEGADEVFDLPIHFTFSGPTEIVYQKFSGNPQTTGSIILTNSISQQRTVSINSKGMIIY